MDKNLQAFLSVVDSGNLKTAADKIGLTQPSITKRLHNMEADIGGPLFDRSGRGMTLTLAGKKFYHRAKRIEQEYLQAREEMLDLTGAGLDVLRVGAGPLFHLRYVPAVFNQLHREFPSVQFELHADTNEKTIPLLQEGLLDIALGILDHPADEMGLRAIPITDVEQAVILPPQSILSNKKQLTHHEVHKLSWILYGGDKSNEQWLGQYFAKNNLGSPSIVLRTSSFSTGLEMVKFGGFAMMAPIRLRSVIESAGLQIRPADPPISQHSAGAYVRPSSLGFGVVKRFITLLEQECGPA